MISDLEDSDLLRTEGVRRWKKRILKTEMCDLIVEYRNNLRDGMGNTEDNSFVADTEPSNVDFEDAASVVEEEGIQEISGKEPSSDGDGSVESQGSEPSDADFENAASAMEPAAEEEIERISTKKPSSEAEETSETRYGGIVDYLEENEGLASVGEITQALGVEKDIVPSLIGDARDRGYDVRRDGSGENYTITLNRDFATDTDLTGDKLWQKVREGKVSGETLSANGLAANGEVSDTRRNQARKLKQILSQSNGSLKYDAVTEKMNQGDSAMANIVAQARRDGMVDFGSNELILRDHKQRGWTEFRQPDQVGGE